MRIVRHTLYSHSKPFYQPFSASDTTVTRLGRGFQQEHHIFMHTKSFPVYEGISQKKYFQFAFLLHGDLFLFGMLKTFHKSLSLMFNRIIGFTHIPYRIIFGWTFYTFKNSKRAVPSNWICPLRVYAFFILHFEYSCSHLWRVTDYFVKDKWKKWNIFNVKAHFTLNSSYGRTKKFKKFFSWKRWTSWQFQVKLFHGKWILLWKICDNSEPPKMNNWSENVVRHEIVR